LSQLDQIFARGQYGLEHQAILPKLNGQQALHIVNGRHPLLGEKAVPLNVTLTADQSLMITGANSGGKTVVLKTIALFSMMVKLGLEIPADEGTNLAVFDQVMIDIGDQQNMAAQLSTFSGEMTTLVNITNDLRPNALILLDEIGSGTDPEEGTALGIAIIQYLIDQGPSWWSRPTTRASRTTRWPNPTL
jgi:Mismatch repair ATPase (MutS family)